jgi:uncharacterized Zn-binding protein involved in type VI secretion
MPQAARMNDATGHGKPLSPGPGSPDVMIGMMAAWRAIPSGMAAGIEKASNAMNSLMTNPALRPPDATQLLADVASGLGEAAGAAGSQGNAGAAAGTASAMSGLAAANVTLTATYTSASAAPGAEPAAATAYAKGLQAAAAAAASAAVSAIAAGLDIHICPLLSGPAPHGPGVVTKGSGTVTINGLPAARQNDKVFEAAGGQDPIAVGCPTVEIGD